MSTSIDSNWPAFLIMLDYENLQWWDLEKNTPALIYYELRHIKHTV